MAVASRASEAGTAYILSTISGLQNGGRSRRYDGSVWYQLYLLGGRPAAEAALDRARKAGYTALSVTVDTVVAGMRERDIRNGRATDGRQLDRNHSVPVAIFLAAGLGGVVSDGWRPARIPNVIIPGQGPMELIDVAAALAGSVVDLAGFRLAARSVARPDRGRRASSLEKTRGERSTWEPRAWSFPITAAANSMAFRRRCGHCRKL